MENGAAHSVGEAAAPSGLSRQLPADEVHVWCADLDIGSAAVSDLSAHLSTPERNRAARFVSPADGDRFVAARGILRLLLGLYLQQAPAELRIETAPHGKPAMRQGAGDSELRFNLSHSHGLAVYAFTLRREIGIDLECMRSEFATEAVARRYFSAQEQSDLRAIPSALRTEAFFLCWTRKEAYLKARGEGLYISLDSFDVSCKPNEPAVLTSPDSARWRLHSFRPRSGYVGALAVEGPASRLCFLDWQNR